MSKFEQSVELPVSAARAFDWHAAPGAFERLTPPFQDVKVVERTLAPGARTILEDGGRVVLSMPFGPIHRRYVARHEGYVPGSCFVDRMEEGPFRSWVHTHRFVDTPSGSTLTDSIEYDVGALAFAADGFAARTLASVFALRHHRTRHDLARHAETPRPLQVGVTGATGLVGTALMPYLSAGGHGVKAFGRAGKGGDIPWDPARGQLDGAHLRGLDAVVHLAGANIAERWTEARRKEVMDSRVLSTRLLAETMAACEGGPRTLVVASGIGYYGDGGEALLDESSPLGGGFAAEVCRQWEAAADAARAAGIRVVHLRIGIVMARQGGALGQLVPVYLGGAGGPVGSGRQWQSWIGLDDLLDVILRSLWDEGLSGVVNAVSPNPLRQADFARVLGRVLSRPAVLPTPAFAMRLAFGEMAEELLLAGARVAPGRLSERGFVWRSPELEGALRLELG